MALVTALVKFALELTMLIIKGTAQLVGALLTLLLNALNVWLANRAPKRTLAHHPRARGFQPKYRKRRRGRGR